MVLISTAGGGEEDVILVIVRIFLLIKVANYSMPARAGCKEQKILLVRWMLKGGSGFYV